MDDQFSSMLFEAVFGLATLVLAWAAKSARDYFKQRVENEYLEGLFLRLTDAVEVGVRDAAQTLVPLVKEASRDRKISMQEAKGLRTAVRDNVLDQLTKVDRESISKLFDSQSLERMIETRIEATVQRMKERV